MATPSSPRRLAQLPGYDTAPDVYETQQTSASSHASSPITRSRATSATSSSPHSSDSESSTGAKINRRRLNPSHARDKFSISAKGLRSNRYTDLGDRVDGERRGYRIRPVSGDEEELDARIARLKREVEECRILSQKGKEAPAPDDETGELEKLGKVLANLDIPQTITTAADSEDEDEADDLNNPQSLSKLSSFDVRLAAIEALLGVNLADPTTTSPPSTSGPLLPTLNLLDQQLSALSTASSLSNLESLSSRISSLRAEAQKLASTNYHLDTSDGGDDDEDAEEEEEEEEEREGGDDADEDADGAETKSHSKPKTISLEEREKLKTLFSLLPTLTTLSPAIPAVLSRLKSLRALHSAAADASRTLDGIERKQEDVGRQLKLWKEGLEKVEEAVGEASNANGKNGRMVKEWVDGLEGRVKALR